MSVDVHALPAAAASPQPCEDSRVLSSAEVAEIAARCVKDDSNEPYGLNWYALQLKNQVELSLCGYCRGLEKALEFIAAARTDVPALCHTAEHFRAETELLQRVIESAPCAPSCRSTQRVHRFGYAHYETDAGEPCPEWHYFRPLGHCNCWKASLPARDAGERPAAGNEKEVRPTATALSRDARQAGVSQWCAAAFGSDHAASVSQRGIRLAEEAIEAAQAAGCDARMVHRLVDHIYEKEPGALAQEIGGVGITVLALAQAAGLSADTEESREFERVLAKPLAHFAARNRAKNEAGFNVFADSSQGSPAGEPPQAEEKP